MTDAKDLVIIGASGNGLGALDAVLAARRDNAAEWRPVGFLDDAPARQGKTIHGVPVLGPLSEAGRLPHAFFVNAIGSTESFRKRPDMIAGSGIREERFANIVHPRAVVSSLARLGRGIILMANSTVCVNACLANHVIVLENSVVNHDVSVDDFSVIAASVSLAGHVKIGRACYLGSGCLVRQGVIIGDGALIGMGAVVLDDVAPGTVMVGNPARALRQKLKSETAALTPL